MSQGMNMLLMTDCVVSPARKLEALADAVMPGGTVLAARSRLDEEFARRSPGILLMIQTMRHAVLRGLHSYESLGQPESGTVMWTQSVRPCLACLAYPAGVNGMTAFASDMSNRYDMVCTQHGDRSRCDKAHLQTIPWWEGGMT